MEDVKGPIIDWSVASMPLAGSVLSGDSYTVKKSGNNVLVAVMDGLGHGEEAAEASRITVDTLMNSESDDLFVLVKLCHGALAKTRGVVMSLASFDAKHKTMTWMGIGNVEGYLKRADADAVPGHESLFRRGGVVGYQLPPLRFSTLAVSEGDTLVLVTDGISSDFDREVNPKDSPQQIADRIIEIYSKKIDDALVLVARFIG
jgi:negative regulator of sigma-B (phosphoserine phosphatase)